MGRVLYCQGCGAEADIIDGRIFPCSFCGSRRLGSHKPDVTWVTPAKTVDCRDPLFTVDDARFLRSIRIAAA